MTVEWRGVIFLSDVHFTDRSCSHKNSRSSFDHSDFDVNLQEARKKAAKISSCIQDIQPVKQINCINFHI